MAGFHHIPSGFALCDSPALVLPSGIITATFEQSAAIFWVSCMDQLCPSAQVLGTQVGSLRVTGVGGLCSCCFTGVSCVTEVFGVVTCALCYPEGTEVEVWECSTLYELSLSCAAGRAVPLGAHRDCCL